MSLETEEIKQSKPRSFSLWNWFVSRISVKLAVIMILVVVIPLFGLGVILTLAAQRAVVESVQRDQSEIAKRTADQVSLFVERPLELLDATASMIAISRTDSREQETVLVELSVMFPFFEEILSVDPDGNILASSNPGKAPVFGPKEKALESIREKKTFQSTVYLSADYLPFMDVAIPYFWRGKVNGALLARINLRGMWDIIDGIRVGRTGRAFLISKKGILIAHPDKKKVLKNIDLSRDPAVTALIQKKTGTLEEIHEGEGNWLVSYAPVHGKLGWGIVIEQKASEAYAFLNYMRWMTLIAGILSILVAILVSVVTARQVVKPVRSLESWSRRISIGDFDYLDTHRSRDELGRLFISFKRMRDRLREAREQEYLAMLGTASSALAHKIKNSIVSLKTLSDLFSSRKSDAHFMEQFEKEFPDAVAHLEHILRQLSKVASEYKLEPVPVDLGELLKQLERKYKDASVKRKIQFRILSADSIPHLEGDRERLYDVFENLIVNAFEAMPRGGDFSIRIKKGKGRIPHPRLISRDNIDLVQITVQDTGSGIPKEKLSDVFRPFITTKQGGMGIGLTVVKKIISQHGGAVEIESEKGKGTAFTILLPLNASHMGIFS